MNQAAQYIRRELAIRLVRAFDAGTLSKEIDGIPMKLRPKNEPSSRCCVYHDRAVLKYRLMALLGYSIEDETDEKRHRLLDALQRKLIPEVSREALFTIKWNVI